MAMDSALKRLAAKGAGRPWLRGSYPTGSGISASERPSIGLAYPVATLATGAIGSVRSERIVIPALNRDVVFARDDRSILITADNRGLKF